MRSFLERLRKGPLAPLLNWIEQHPRLSGWLILASVMTLFLVIEAYDVGFGFFQWVFLLLATWLVAWICVWIISWDEED